MRRIKPEVTKGQMRALYHKADAAIRKYHEAVTLVYPPGSRVSWMHGNHQQRGEVLHSEQNEFGHDMSPTLGVRNIDTGKVVRVSLYSIELAEGYDRFAKKYPR